MRIKTVDEFVTAFREEFPDTEIATTDGQPRIFSWSEVRNVSAVNYWSPWPAGMYRGHVLEEICAWAEARGWFAETVNPECADFYLL